MSSPGPHSPQCLQVSGLPLPGAPCRWMPSGRVGAWGPTLPAQAGPHLTHLPLPQHRIPSSLDPSDPSSVVSYVPGSLGSWPPGHSWWHTALSALSWAGRKPDAQQVLLGQGFVPNPQRPSQNTQASHLRPGLLSSATHGDVQGQGSQGQQVRWAPGDWLCPPARPSFLPTGPREKCKRARSCSCRTDPAPRLPAPGKAAKGRGKAS